MHFPILVLIASSLFGTAAYGASNQIDKGPPPKWVVNSEPMAVPSNAAGAVFVRRQDSAAHVDDKGQLFYNGYLIKILHPSALQLGNISLVWNPSAGSPIVHVIKIHRDGQEIDVLKTAQFEILRREDQLEQARLDGNLTAVLRIPDLRVGDELEFGATIPANDPTLGKDGAGVLLLSPEPPPGRYHLRLSWENSEQPNVKMTPDMAAVAQKSANAIEYHFDNPPTVAMPKDAPPRYQWQRTVEYSRFNDWQSISRRFAPLFAEASQLNAASPLKQEAARIAAAHASPLDRAAAALKLVQQDVRYIYVGLNGGNLAPASAEDTWSRRYGDCKGKTVLLLALLRELGIDAEPVLVNNSGADDGLDERLPSPNMFDHVLVRARIDGNTYWMDGTMPAVVRPEVAPALPYQWVLPLTAKGNGIEQLPWSASSRPDSITLFEIDARAGFDKPARISSTTLKRGIEGLQQEVQLSAATPAQLLSAFRQNGIGSTWQSIDDVQWRYDVKAQASILTIVGTGTVDWDDDGDGIKSLALAGGGFSPPDKRIRASDQDQTAPYYNKPAYDCFVTTVHLPSTTKAEQWSYNANIDNQIFGRTYYRAFDIRDGSLRMIRGSRVEQKEVDASKAQSDNARISAFNNSMAWLTYNPDGKNRKNAAATPVPATQEQDWTADNVPCLANRPKS